MGGIPLEAYIGMRSLTYAQRAARYLTGKGLAASAARAPWSGNGCAYALRLRPRDLEQGKALLRQAGFVPGSVYIREKDGTLREAVP